MEKYRNREQAGIFLSEQFKEYANRTDVTVLGLPRGGIPVAYEIAKTLSAPLEAFIVRKLGMPGHEELAMGAIATGGVTVFNKDVLQRFQISEEKVQNVIRLEEQELKRRDNTYRGNKPFPKLTDRIIILVDDGIATGATMRAAILALRQQKPKSIIVAVPVAANTTCEEIETIADKIVCPLRPKLFYAVGAWYDHFDQTTDDEVRELLAKANIIVRTR